MPFLLGDLLKGAAKGELPALGVSGVNADSRAVARGEVFFAVPGTRVHGMAFVDQALARGAVAIVSDRQLETDPGIPVIVVEDVRAAYARAAARSHLPQPATAVAVTGTNGKSSIVSFVRQIWSAAGLRAASLGTVGIETDAGIAAGELTTPDALTLHRALQRLAEGGIDHVALEASSQGLDQRRVDGITFQAVAFTNLSRDHLDYHPDMQAYAEAKLRLFRDLAVPGAAAIVNADDPWHEPFLRTALDRGLTLMTIGREGAFFEINEIANAGYGQRVTGRLVGEPVTFQLPLTGAFQAYNAIVAIAMAMATGVSKEQALGAIARLKGARGRLERVAEHNSAAIFVDYAHKPVALQSALAALRPYASGRLIVVIGAGGDRDPGKRPMMGAAAHVAADIVIVTDDNPRSEDPATIRAAVLAAAPGAIEIGDRRAAIVHAVGLLQPGDVLLVAGKGHEDYQIIGTTKQHFSDHEVIVRAVADAS